jgi:hypothetical protein
MQATYVLFAIDELLLIEREQEYKSLYEDREDVTYIRSSCNWDSLRELKDKLVFI